MNTNKTLFFAFGLPILFLIGVGFYLNIRESKVQEIATPFYYATVTQGTFGYKYTDYGRFPLTVVQGRVAFIKDPTNSFFQECEYLQGVRPVDVSGVPSICLTQDTNTLLRHAMERGLKVYEHDVKKNESREMINSQDIVNLFGINSDAKSPEGFVFESYGYYRNGGGDIFFDFSGGSSQYEAGSFLVRKNKRILMNLRPSTQQTIHFLGWAR